MSESGATLEPDEVPLRQAVKKGGFKFPVVVATCGQSDVYEFPDSSQSLPTDVYEIPDSSQSLPTDCLLLLEDQVNISYAQIKVLPLADEQDIREKKGAEYVSEYNRLVGKQFLIPLNLPNKVKIVHRPGTPRTYTNISQVLESLPRFMRAQSKVTSTVHGSDEKNYVSKGTIIELTKIIRSRDSLLECTACNQNRGKHYFERDSTVDFIAIDDLKSYTLVELMDKVLLPTVVKTADCIVPNDVIVYDDELASQTLLMTIGPLEVIRKKRRFFIVGWLRTRDTASQTATCKRIMIPNSLWDKDMVRVFRFHSKKSEDEFCRKKFKIKVGKTFKEYENKLYVIPPEDAGITYLRPNEAMATFVDGDSSDDSSDYEKPISAPPPRPPKKDGDGLNVNVAEKTDLPAEETVLLPIPMNKVRPDVWKKLVEKAKLGFGHIHNELQYFFSVKSSSSERGQLYSATSQQDLHKSHKSDKETWTPLSRTTKVEQAAYDQQKPMPKPKPDQKPPVAVPINLRFTPTPPKSGNYEETPPVVPARPPKPQARSQSISESTVQTEHAVDGKRRSASFSAEQPTVTRPLPPIPATDNEDTGYDYDYPVIHDWVPEEKKAPAYQKVAAVEIQRVTRKNQTAKDFCEYTVNQVRECFKLCAMDNLAQVCSDEKIDGAFLASYDLEELRNEPFNLSAFNVNKVKMIIQEGWRPSDS